MNTGNPKVDWLRIALGVEATTLLRDPLARRESGEQSGSRGLSPHQPTLRFWRDGGVDGGVGDGGVGDGPVVDAPPADAPPATPTAPPPATPTPAPPDPKAKRRFLEQWNPLIDRIRAADFEPSATPKLKELYDKWKAISDDVDAKFDAGNFAACLAALPAAKDALKAYFAEAEAVDKKAKPQAVAAANKISTLVKKNELAGKTNAEKLELLHALRAPATKMTDEFKKAQFEIYKTLEVDPKFVAEDKKKREQTVKALVGTDKDKAEMKKTQDNWKNLKPAEKEAFVRKIIATHCKVLGIPEPKNIEFQDRGAIRVSPTTKKTEDGEYNHEKGRLLINSYPGGSFGDFTATLDTIFHENSHHYQHELVDKLNNGNLPKEDPEYEEALLLRANFEPQGVVESHVDKDAYRNQPSEKHSFSNGPDTAKAVLDELNR